MFFYTEDAKRWVALYRLTHTHTHTHTDPSLSLLSFSLLGSHHGLQYRVCVHVSMCVCVCTGMHLSVSFVRVFTVLRQSTTLPGPWRRMAHPSLHHNRYATYAHKCTFVVTHACLLRHWGRMKRHSLHRNRHASHDTHTHRHTHTHIYAPTLVQKQRGSTCLRPEAAVRHKTCKCV